jgi:hypothetical protein
MPEQKPSNGQWPNAKATEQARRAKIHHAITFDAAHRKRPPITLPRLKCLAEPMEEANPT